MKIVRGINNTRFITDRLIVMAFKAKAFSFHRYYDKEDNTMTFFVRAFGVGLNIMIKDWND